MKHGKWARIDDIKINEKTDKKIIIEHLYECFNMFKVRDPYIIEVDVKEEINQIYRQINFQSRFSHYSPYYDSREFI